MIHRKVVRDRLDFCSSADLIQVIHFKSLFFDICLCSEEQQQKTPPRRTEQTSKTREMTLISWNNM